MTDTPLITRLREGEGATVSIDRKAFKRGVDDVLFLRPLGKFLRALITAKETEHAP